MKRGEKLPICAQMKKEEARWITQVDTRESSVCAGPCTIRKKVRTQLKYANEIESESVGHSCNKET